MASEILRIGLTMRVVEACGYQEPRDALAQDWPKFLGKVFSKSAWIYLPNIGATAIRQYCKRWHVNRLILTGGEDFGVCQIRDETEMDLLSWAKGNHMPVLGICRGMQMMAKFAGVGLKPLAAHTRVRHRLSGRIRHEVNSFHCSGLTSCPTSFKVSARSPDGEIEGILNEDLRWEGWMWHPERETPYASADINRIRKLFS